MNTLRNHKSYQGMERREDAKLVMELGTTPKLPKEESRNLAFTSTNKERENLESIQKSLAMQIQYL